MNYLLSITALRRSLFLFYNVASFDGNSGFQSQSPFPHFNIPNNYYLDSLHIIFLFMFYSLLLDIFHHLE